MKRELDSLDKARIHMLYQQIIEIACGNFMYRLEPSGKRDYIDTIAVLLNMMSEEIYHFCFEAEHKQEEQHFQMALILDNDLNVVSYTSGLLNILKWDENVLNIHISNLLSKNSKAIFDEHFRSFKEDLENNFFVIDFLTAENSYYRSHCRLERMVGNTQNELFLMTAFKNLYKYAQKENQDDFKNDATNDRARSTNNGSATTKLLLRNVRLYILRNLHTSLPSLRELGLIHQTNKTKLKEEFKKMYGTTIHRFHMEKRIEKAGLLIRNTELPISEITQKCGFKDHSHFSKNFKLQFGQTPTQHRRLHLGSVS
ncbi:AraC family transcriptional regulator [Gramella sp. AN32]|uniref:Helix-turn-helix domain-containing protein n=1 Tax=Christiangramia antarctica TaxID=2058158 RepID=A0ABW5X8Q3_9FLAO|nr:AraC family transcriptional regulator [Gramella sp. AN32]MCM4157613.1 AraC family transcriptional regulator [Gramella sp. AN32]